MNIEQVDSLIQSLIPSWNEKDTKLNFGKASIEEDQLLESIKKIPSWDQKGTNLLSNRSLYLFSILIPTTEPIKLQKFMDWIDYKFRKTFNDLYMDPLMKVGFVTRTIQDKPKDPEQKYVITESGRLFLVGS